MAWLVKEAVIIFGASHINGHDTRKISRPLRGGEVVVVTRGHDVDSFEVSFVNPLLVLKDMFR